MTGLIKASDIGVLPDGGFVPDAVIGAGVKDLFSPSSGFTDPTVVGKPMYVAGAGAGGGLLISSVDTYVSASHVVLHDAAAVAVSGAQGQWGTDWTGAISTAMASATRGGKFLFDDVGYFNCEVNLTKKNSFALCGLARGVESVQPGTVLVPVPGRATVIDGTSAYGVSVRHMQVGSNLSPVTVPVGIQFAYGSQPSGDIWIQDVHACGNFNWGGLVCYGPENSHIEGSQFCNSFHQGFGGVFMSTNVFGITSDYDTVQTGLVGMGAWCLTKVGFSDHVPNPPSHRRGAIYLQGASLMLFLSCEFDSSTDTFGAVYLAPAGSSPCSIQMDSCIVYSESQPNPPKYAIWADGAPTPHTVYERANSYTFGTAKNGGGTINFL